MKNKIKYYYGDATYPNTNENVIIAHVCNDIGKWGRGFVLALSKRWPSLKEDYILWSKYGTLQNPFKLGQVQFVQVEPNIIVANMVAQRDIITVNSVPPIRYDSLQTCLLRVIDKSMTTNSSVHMPKIGAGLAGGDWDIIEGIINDTLIAAGISVKVYEYGQ